MTAATAAAAPSQANMTDTLRHMALNDEERPVDLEMALEMALKAWLRQVRWMGPDGALMRQACMKSGLLEGQHQVPRVLFNLF
jgi:hypothetical protein